MVQGPGQYMNGMMPPQGALGANGMMGGQMAQMGGRTGDLDNGDQSRSAIEVHAEWSRESFCLFFPFAFFCLVLLCFVLFCFVL